MTGNADLVRTVREALADAADAEKAAPMQAYMKSAMPFHGISSPVLRSLLSPLLAAHPLPDHDTWAGTILALWDGAAFREERYAALAPSSPSAATRCRGCPAERRCGTSERDL